MQLPCPSCSQMLEAPVPLPASAKCPFCGHVFVPVPPPASPELAPGGVPGPASPAPSPVAELVKQRLLPPAVLLIITGVFWTLVALVQLIVAVKNLGQPQLLPAFVQVDPNAMQMIQRISEALSLILHPLSVIMGGLIVCGGLRMMQLRSYGLAVTASVLAMIPCTFNCCCLMGLPVGIWALVVLANPTVRMSFP